MIMKRWSYQFFTSTLILISLLNRKSPSNQRQILQLLLKLQKMDCPCIERLSNPIFRSNLPISLKNWQLITVYTISFPPFIFLISFFFSIFFLFIIWLFFVDNLCISNRFFHCFMYFCYTTFNCYC